MNRTCTAIMSMFGTTMPARWEAAASLVGAVEPSPRMHFYREGETESVCFNRKRIIGIALLWTHDFTVCPRCIESFTFAGEPVPPAPLRPEDE